MQQDWWLLHKVLPRQAPWSCKMLTPRGRQAGNLPLSVSASCSPTGLTCGTFCVPRKDTHSLWASTGRQEAGRWREVASSAGSAPKVFPLVRKCCRRSRFESPWSRAPSVPPVLPSPSQINPSERPTPQSPCHRWVSHVTESSVCLLLGPEGQERRVFLCWEQQGAGRLGFSQASSSLRMQPPISLLPWLCPQA